MHLHRMSLPTRGAWIEIVDLGGYLAGALGRSPHGERGLKSDSYMQQLTALLVAPHTGSVD